MDHVSLDLELVKKCNTMQSSYGELHLSSCDEQREGSNFKSEKTEKTAFFSNAWTGNMEYIASGYDNMPQSQLP